MLDISAWSYCYINLVCRALPLYPQVFEDAAKAIMQTELGMTKADLNIRNAKRVYTHLVDTLEE